MLNRENSINNLKNDVTEDHNGIKIKELPFSKKINLRIDPNNKNHMSVSGKILGIILPTKSNTYSSNNKTKAIWLSPDEWLIVNDDDTDIYSKLKNEFKDVDTSVTDLTDNKTILCISGKKIYFLLSKFLVLDLQKNLMNDSTCAQTLFVKVPITIVNNNSNSEIPSLDLYINRSQANYVYNLIVDGTKNLEF